MVNRYDAVLDAIFNGRTVTKDMVTGDPADRRAWDEFPIVTNEAVAGVDVERFLGALDAQRNEIGGDA